jgi:hypothetical protein
LISYTIRKLINTNGNIKEIFLSVNFWGILPTEIFPGIYRGNYRGKKIKTKQKKWWRVIFTNRITDGFFNSVSIFQRAPKLFTFQLHC